MLRLPAASRGAFKEPLGPIYTDAETLLSAAERARRRHADGEDVPLITVGDAVTAHLLRVGRTPDIAVVDGRTEREAVDENVRETLDSAPGDRIEVKNPPATLSRQLLAALVESLGCDGPATIGVDGEEDLATLPAILVAPDGASVCYGQPGEGMVHVAVTPATRREARTLLSRLEGDLDAALDLLGVSEDV